MVNKENLDNSYFVRNKSQGENIVTLTDSTNSIHVHDENLISSIKSSNKYINFNSSSYISLNKELKVKNAVEKAIKEYGVGSYGFLTPYHVTLESHLKQIYHAKNVLLYKLDINSIIIPALVGEKDYIFLDSNLKSSLKQMAENTKSNIISFEHNNMVDLETKIQATHPNNFSVSSTHRKLIITEGVYELQGDVCNVPEIITISKKYNCISLLDESNALSVIGDHGLGSYNYHKCDGIDIITCSMEIPLCSSGSFAIMNEKVMNWIKEQKSSVLSEIDLHSVTPLAAASAEAALDMIMEDSKKKAHNSSSTPSLSKTESPATLHSQLLQNIKHWKKGCQNIGLECIESDSAIVAVKIGEDDLIKPLTNRLLENKLKCSFVMYPDLPRGQGILKFKILRTMTSRILDQSLEIFQKVVLDDFPVIVNTPKINKELHIENFVDPTKPSLFKENIIDNDSSIDYPKAYPKFAIIGTGIRLPGDINNKDDFWKMMKEKKTITGLIPDDRWDREEWYNATPKPATIQTRHGGFIDKAYDFDNKYFSISQAEAIDATPEQRWLCELTVETVEDANINIDHFKDTQTGVFVGTSGMDYGGYIFSVPEQITKYTFSGIEPSIHANRLSYLFNLHGPSLSVNTACSSSMTALSIACNSMAAGDCEMAIVAGSNFLQAPSNFVAYSQLRVVSKNGACRPFDIKADGYARLEGAAMVLLKPYEKAVRDNNKIYATILSTACNEDGKTPSLTMPSSEAQCELMKRVYQKGRVDPCTIDFIEAHGTGTPVGDPIETQSIGNAYGVTNKIHGNPPIPIGSVKGNVGHGEYLSGVVGLLKATMVLYNKAIVPTAAFDKLNPKIDCQKLGIRIVDQYETLPSTGVHRAVVNSFGFGGANANAILEDEHHINKEDISITLKKKPNQEKNGMTIGQDQVSGPLLAFFSGFNLHVLKETLKKWLNVPREFLLPMLYIVASTRQVLNHRLFVYVETPEDFYSAIKEFIDEDDEVLANQYGGIKETEKLLYVEVKSNHKKGLTFTYDDGLISTSQFTKSPESFNVCRELFQNNTYFADCINYCDKVYGVLSHGRSIVHDYSLFSEEPDEGKFNQLKIDLATNPMIMIVLNGILQLALTALLKHFGVSPTATVGYGIGEVAATYASEMIDLKEAMTILYHYGRVLEKANQQSPKNYSINLKCSLADVHKKILIKLSPKEKPSISISGIESPMNCTLSGSLEVLKKIIEIAKVEGIALNSEVIMDKFNIHSVAITEEMKKDLENSLQNINSRDSNSAIPFYSGTLFNKEGHCYKGQLDGKYWWLNMRNPALYAHALSQTAMAQQKDGRNILEIGFGFGSPILCNSSKSFYPKENIFNLFETPSTTTKASSTAKILNYNISSKHFIKTISNLFAYNSISSLDFTNLWEAYAEVKGVPSMKNLLSVDYAIPLHTWNHKYLRKLFKAKRNGLPGDINENIKTDDPVILKKIAEQGSTTVLKKESKSASSVVIKTSGKDIQSISPATTTTTKSLKAVVNEKALEKTVVKPILNTKKEEKLEANSLSRFLIKPTNIVKKESLPMTKPVVHDNKTSVKQPTSKLIQNKENVSISNNTKINTTKKPSVIQKSKNSLLERGQNQNTSKINLTAISIPILFNKEKNNNSNNLSEKENISTIHPKISSPMKINTHITNSYASSSSPTLSPTSTISTSTIVSSTLSSSPSTSTTISSSVEMNIDNTKLSSTDDEFWTFENHKYLVDHQVNNQVVLPAAGSISRALYGYKRSRELMNSKEGCVTLNQVEFSNLTVFQKTKEEQLNKTGPIPMKLYENEQNEFHLKHVDGSAICKGIFSSSPRHSIHNIPNLKEVINNCSTKNGGEGIRGAQLYQRASDIELQYGPEFRLVQSGRVGSLYSYTKINVNQAHENIICHPAVLDSCFHSVISLGIGCGDRQVLPFKIEHFELANGGYFPEGIMTCAIELLSQDLESILVNIYLYDSNKKPIGKIINMEFLLRKLKIIKPSEWINTIMYERITPQSSRTLPIKCQKVVLFCETQQLNEVNAYITPYVVSMNIILFLISDMHHENLTNMIKEGRISNEDTMVIDVRFLQNYDIEELFNSVKLLTVNHFGFVIASKKVNGKEWKNQEALFAVDNVIFGMLRTARSEERNLPIFSIQTNTIKEFSEGLFFGGLSVHDPEIIVDNSTCGIVAPRFIPSKSIPSIKSSNFVSEQKLVGHFNKTVFRQCYGIPKLLSEQDEDYMIVKVESLSLQNSDVIQSSNLELAKNSKGSMVMECLGYVIDLGENIKNSNKIKVGDLVYGINHQSDHLVSSYVKIHKDLAIPIYEKEIDKKQYLLSSIYSYSTALYILRDICNIQYGQKVLVHSSSSNITQALASLCRKWSIDIIVSNTSKTSQNYKDVPCFNVNAHQPEKVYSNVMDLTNQKGVDIVIDTVIENSESMILELSKCIKSNGKYINVGIPNNNIQTIITNQRKDEVEYQCAQMSQLDTKDLGLLIEIVYSLVINNIVDSIEFKTYQVTQINKAILEILSGKVTEKLCLSLENNEVECLPPNLFDPNKSYLVTGAFGGVGLRVCMWMQQQGVRHLVLTTSSDANKRMNHPIIKGLQNKGVEVMVRQCDISDFNSVEKLFKETTPKISGVFHLANKFVPKLIRDSSIKDFYTSFDPKARGAYNLHKISQQGYPLSSFVLFSSVLDFLGNTGQIAYGASNSYLRNLVNYRRSQGLCGNCIALTAMKGSGYLSQWKQDRQSKEFSEVIEFLDSEDLPEILNAVLRDDIDPCVQLMNGIKINSEFIRHVAPITNVLKYKVENISYPDMYNSEFPKVQYIKEIEEKEKEVLVSVFSKTNEDIKYHQTSRSNSPTSSTEESLGESIDSEKTVGENIHNEYKKSKKSKLMDLDSINYIQKVKRQYNIQNISDTHVEEEDKKNTTTTPYYTSTLKNNQYISDIDKKISYQKLETGIYSMTIKSDYLNLEYSQMIANTFDYLKNLNDMQVLIIDCQEDFCKGFDPNYINTVRQMGPDNKGKIAEEIYSIYSNYLKINEINVPVICCLDGQVSDAGLTMALLSNWKIATRHTNINTYKASLNFSIIKDQCIKKGMDPKLIDNMLDTFEIQNNRNAIQAYKYGIIQDIASGQESMKNLALKKAHSIINYNESIESKISKQYLNDKSKLMNEAYNITSALLLQ